MHAMLLCAARRGERQEAEHDQPLSLLELFDADGAAAGGQGPRSESPGASDCSECEWDGEWSWGLSRAGRQCG